MCPVAPQNMHSLLSKHCFHSTGSNLISLPRTDSMIVAGIELEDFWELLLLNLEANAGEVDLAGIEILDATSVNLPLL